MISSFSDIIKQFIKFGLVGVSNTVISLGITYGIIFLCHSLNANVGENWLVFAASLVGFVVSVLNSYYWNNKYVFKKTKSGHLWPLLKSYICYGSTWLISYVLTYVFVNLMGISVVLVPVLSMVITIPLNFFMNKFWAFK